MYIIFTLLIGEKKFIKTSIMLKEREKNKFCMHILGAITGHEGMKKIT